MRSVIPVWNIKDSEKLLIVAPHPDDETIGCGGILALYGPQCDVLLLTDGRRGIPEGSTLTRDETAAIRKEEFTDVMAFFRVREYKMLGLPDGELVAHAQAVSAVDLTAYDRIFVPNRRERHPDHQAAFAIIDRLCKKQKAKAELIEYEVWSPHICANRFLDVSAIMDTKIAALQRYRSQTASIDYEALVRGLNMYRGAPHHVAYCEAFCCGAAKKKGLKEAAARIVPRGLRRGMANMKNTFKA